MVESALTITVYLAFVIATMELAQSLFMFQTYSDRARHALRLVCVRTYDATTEATIQNWIMYDQATVPEGSDGNTGYLGIRRSNISLTASLPGNSSDRLTVRISNYSYSILSYALFGRSTSFTGRTIQYSHSYEPPLT